MRPRRRRGMRPRRRRPRRGSEGRSGASFVRVVASCPSRWTRRRGSPRAREAARRRLRFAGRRGAGRGGGSESSDTAGTTALDTARPVRSRVASPAGLATNATKVRRALNSKEREQNCICRRCCPRLQREAWGRLRLRQALRPK